MALGRYPTLNFHLRLCRRLDMGRFEGIFASDLGNMKHDEASLIPAATGIDLRVNDLRTRH